MRSREFLVAGSMSLIGALLATSQVAAVTSVWSPQIAIVWPQDGQGHQTLVNESQAVNISVWPGNQVSCTAPPLNDQQHPLTFYSAKNNEPVSLIGPGQMIQRTSNGVTFPTLEFNDVSADLGDNPSAQFRMVVLSESFNGSLPSGSNVWVHAADARTLLPNQIIPTGLSGVSLTQLDTRIQIVWPHDELGHPASVATARFANIAVDIFEHGTLLSVPVGYQPPGAGRLLEGLGNLPISATAPGTLGRLLPQASVSTYIVNGQSFPRWTFNDVPISAGIPYHFLVLIDGVKTFPVIWTHALDPRTILPNPQVPAACVAPRTLTTRPCS